MINFCVYVCVFWFLEQSILSLVLCFVSFVQMARALVCVMVHSLFDYLISS